LAAKDVPHQLHRFPHHSSWAGLRLKAVVQKVLPNLGSRSALLVITNGLVSIENGEAITDADAMLPADAVLLIDLRHGVHGRGKAKHPHLHERMQVLHDDNHIVVVSKRAGTLVQPDSAAGNEKNQSRGAPLVELLKHYWRAKEETSVNPVIVQRLDVETSGLLVLAKTVDAGRKLQAQLKPPRKLRREYLAITAGVFQVEKGVWKTHFGRGPLGVRQSLAEANNKQPVRQDLQFAETRFEVVELFEQASLVRLRLETGRTHQIRIHCAEAGHPLLGETLYDRLTNRLFDRLSKGKFEPRSKENPAQEALRLVRTGQLEIVQPKRLPPRIALHSTRISFIHPGTGKKMEFEAPLPDDLERYVARLRGK
jgi:23S rRNA pseudouridine1911/1915/1917 synthase